MKKANKSLINLFLFINILILISCNLLNANTSNFQDIIKEYNFRNFDHSMYANLKYRHDYYELKKRNNEEAQFIELMMSRYNSLLMDMQRLWCQEPRIPKIIHQIWLGPKPFPAKYKKLRETWIQKHPGWVFKLWTDEDVENFDLVNKEFFYNTPSWAEKANLLRYEILNHFGGVYIDTDCGCFKPLTFLHHCCDFYAGLENVSLEYGRFIVGNAIIGAKPGHPIFPVLIEGIKKTWPQHYPWSVLNQLERSGTRYFTRTVKEVIKECDERNLVFPANVFYPVGSRTVPPESIQIHHWDGTWAH